MKEIVVTDVDVRVTVIVLEDLLTVGDPRKQNEKKRNQSLMKKLSMLLSFHLIMKNCNQ